MLKTTFPHSLFDSWIHGHTKPRWARNLSSVIFPKDCASILAPILFPGQMFILNFLSVVCEQEIFNVDLLGPGADWCHFLPSWWSPHFQRWRRSQKAHNASLQKRILFPVNSIAVQQSQEQETMLQLKSSSLRIALQTSKRQLFLSWRRQIHLWTSCTPCRHPRQRHKNQQD